MSTVDNTDGRVADAVVDNGCCYAAGAAEGARGRGRPAASGSQSRGTPCAAPVGAGRTAAGPDVAPIPPVERAKAPAANTASTAIAATAVSDSMSVDGVAKTNHRPVQMVLNVGSTLPGYPARA
jgi:hypothetical protein